MEEPFYDTLYLALVNRGCHVRPMQTDSDENSGIFRVSLDNGKVYTVTFSLPE